MSKILYKGGEMIRHAFSRLVFVLLLAGLGISLGISGGFANQKYAAIVVDANNGKILHSRSAYLERYPASLTKMMTLYLVFEDMKKGKITKSSKLKVSKKAAARPPSKLWLRAGSTITVDNAIKALVAKSANDVATAIAENLSKSQKEFAIRMTRKAKQLGMKNTRFRNANGLTNRNQKTTAADMAVLGMALRKHFPQYYHYFSARTFNYGRQKIKNHNKLLGKVNGVDGIKTGFTSASGFNLVTSVEKEGRSIVAVVMGGRSSKSRDRQMKKLVAEFLPKASKSAPKPVYVSLPRKVATPIASPRKTVIAKTQKVKTQNKQVITGNKIAGQITKAKTISAGFRPERFSIEEKIVQAQNKSDNKSGIADKIEQAHAMSIGTGETNNKISQAIKLAWNKQSQNNNGNGNNQGLSAIIENSGWQIQITATDSKEKAQQLLQEARDKNSDILANVKTKTVPITLKSGKTLYRARFVGFTSKQTAKQACDILRKKQFQCMLLKVS